MVRLLIIADDFTGALDTAIHFGEKAPGGTVVFLTPQIPWDSLGPEIRVVVVNTDSRHLPPHQAYDLTAELAAQARRRAVPMIFKKVDSAFRGNPGAELQALLDRGGSGGLYLLPAFPDGGRTTEKGVQLWDGVPIGETAYGKDPFAPVQESEISRILARQTAVPTHLVGAGEALPEAREGILLVDASSNEQLEARCRTLLNREGTLLLGGCAGLSKALAGALFGRGKVTPPEAVPGQGKLLIVSGSLHQVSRSQVHWARARGIPCLTLEPDRQLQPGYLETPQGHRFLAQAREAWERRNVLILETAPGAADPGLRDSISDQIALVAESVYRTQEAGTVALAVFGGDTLLKTARRLLRDGLYPQRELEPGVPLSLARTREGQVMAVVSKSGGFGSEAVINTLLQAICGTEIGG